MYRFGGQGTVKTVSQNTTREFSNRITFGYFDTSTSPYSFVKQHVVCELKECTVEQSICAGDKLTMGGACSASLNASFVAREADTGSSATSKTTTTANFIENYAYKDKIAFVECGIKFNSLYGKDYYYYIPEGYFVITEVESDDNGKTFTITGYDYMSTVMNDKNDPFNLTSENDIYIQPRSGYYSVLAKVAEHFGLAYDNEYNNFGSGIIRALSAAELNTLQGLTWREALDKICGVVGCAARLTTSNKLRFDFYSCSTTGSGANKQPYITIPPEQQYQGGFIKLTDSSFTISSITSNDNEGDNNTYTAGSGTGISFTNPLVKHNDLTNILDRIAYYKQYIYDISEYMPCEILWRGNPCVEAGDVVSATYNGSTYTVLVSKLTVDLVGGLSMKITCPPADNEVRYGTDAWVNEQELASNISDVRVALAEATAAINGAEGGYIQINDKNNDGNPDEILITQVEGGATGNVIRLNSGGIGLSTAGDSEPAYTVAITGSGINASVINVGTLNADRIAAGSLSGDKITAGTLNGDRIVAGSITADKLNLGSVSDTETITLLKSKWYYPNTEKYGSANVVYRTDAVFVLDDYTQPAWADTADLLGKTTTDGKVYQLRFNANVDPLAAGTSGAKIQLKAYKFFTDSPTWSDGRLVINNESPIAELTYDISDYRSGAQVVTFEADADFYVALKIDFINCAYQAVIGNFTYEEITKGEMLTAGQIKSRISPSYIDLDVPIISIQGKTFKTEQNSEGIKIGTSKSTGKTPLILTGVAQFYFPSSPYPGIFDEGAGFIAHTDSSDGFIFAGLEDGGNTLPTIRYYDTETETWADDTVNGYLEITPRAVRSFVTLSAPEIRIYNTEISKLAVTGYTYNGYARLQFGDSTARTMIEGNGAEVTTSITFNDAVTINGDTSISGDLTNNGNVNIGDSNKYCYLTGEELILDFYRTDSGAHGTLWMSAQGELMFTVNGTQHTISMN